MSELVVSFEDLAPGYLVRAALGRISRRIVVEVTCGPRFVGAGIVRTFTAVAGEADGIIAADRAAQASAHPPPLISAFAAWRAGHG